MAEQAKKKRCPSCGTLKPASHFRKGERPCRACRNKRHADWLRNTPGAYAKKKEAERGYYVKHRQKKWATTLARLYGMSPDDYERMLFLQGSRCAICRNGFKEKGEPHVDHDHTTGKVRGMLCGGCNSVLAHSRDNPDTLRKAAEYLEES